MTPDHSKTPTKATEPFPSPVLPSPPAPPDISRVAHHFSHLRLSLPSSSVPTNNQLPSLAPRDSTRPQESSSQPLTFESTALQ